MYLCKVYFQVQYKNDIGVCVCCEQNVCMYVYIACVYARHACVRTVEGCRACVV